MKTFSDLAVPDPLVAALAKLGITEPTPIQEAGIPVVREGRDACLQAETGTGKTLAYLLPLFLGLLAARLIAAIRGPLFMRDAALSLTHLLAFDFSNTDDGLWEIWRPVPLDGAHVTPSKPALARGICP